MPATRWPLGLILIPQCAKGAVEVAVHDDPRRQAVEPHSLSPAARLSAKGDLGSTFGRVEAM